MNPIQMLQGFLAKGLSPQKITEQMVGNNNPMMANLVKMANAEHSRKLSNRHLFSYNERTYNCDNRWSCI